ncbi:MAG: hypothetical protein JNK76_05560 [Planctomycetales bacterium]|nr:hypothetical protein [Planctomycetales bacterium]
MPRALRLAYLTLLAAAVLPKIPLTDDLLPDSPALILLAVCAGLLAAFLYVRGRFLSNRRLHFAALSVAAFLLGGVLGEQIETFGRRWNYEHGRHSAAEGVDEPFVLATFFACLIPLCADVRQSLSSRQAGDDRRWNFAVRVLLALAILTLSARALCVVHDRFYPPPPGMLTGLGSVVIPIYAYTIGLGLTVAACVVQLARNRWDVGFTAVTVVAQWAYWCYWQLRMVLD